MSGSGEYTTTPNLGLYKPTYNADAEQWGNHLNANADVLDGALVANGGTLTGPLYYTATGGTTSRSAQDRAADVANVRDYGADPTNGADSTAAFQAALATGKAVYAPKGLYKITDMLTVGVAQQFYGDGRSLTRLYVYSAFNMSALGVVRLMSGGEPGGSIRDMSIEIQQSGATSRATLINYPPAIYARGAARFRIQNVLISNAMTGLDARDNCGGSFIERFEVCAYEFGMRWEGSLDAVHINKYHFWPFAVGSLASVFADGVNVAAEFGKVDGCMVTDLVSLNGKVIFLNSPASTQGWFEIEGMAMDAEQATVRVDNCNWLHLTNFYSTKSGSAANPPSLAVAGGYVRVSQFEIIQGTIAAPVQVTGGNVHLASGSIRKGGSKNGQATVSGGFLSVEDVECTDSGSGALGNALFIQSGTGVLRVQNSFYTGSCTSGTALSYAADDPKHSVSNFGYGVLSLDIPAAVKANPLAMSRYDIPRRGSLTSSTSFNTGYGLGALASAAAGSSTNSAFGELAGTALTTGTSNSLFGHGAGQAITTATLNTLFGRLAGSGFTTGGANTGFGFGVMQASTGANNSAYGRQAGSGITTGNSNSIFGHQVGSGGNLGAGQGNILIGVNNTIDTPTLDVSHTFRFGGTGGVTFFAQGLDTLTPAWAFLGTVNFNTINVSASMNINSTTIRSGTGAATGTQPAGSLWLRTDGATGTRIYVSSGGGTWLPIAGV